MVDKHFDLINGKGRFDIINTVIKPKNSCLFTSIGSDVVLSNVCSYTSTSIESESFTIAKGTDGRLE